ncbi:MAG TPA: YgaP-like transmembrane domain [Pseudodesulfovibrio sp.]|nr:YgaP-like transmembrane domain [Pseudodesulfovibrio sp.]
MKTLSKTLDANLEAAESLPWNLNIAERVLRVSLGSALFAIPFYIHGPLTWEFAALSFAGLYLGMTGSIGWDPTNALLQPETHSSRDRRYASITRQVIHTLEPKTSTDTALPKVGHGPAAQVRPDRTGYDRAA